GCVRECRCIKELRNPFRVVPRVLPTQGSGWRRNPGLEYAAPSGQIAGKTTVVVEYQPGIQQEPYAKPKVISVKKHTSLLVLLPSFCVAMTARSLSGLG
ncbi:MAG: hypothetical protein BECKG1743D_GA0114223_108152, partial [Candidatus Kentron sp. G]